MTPQAYRNMVVPAAHVDLARSICATLAPSGGFAMFGVGLSPDGTEPATHYVSTGHIDADFAGLMPLQEYVQDENGDWQPTDFDWSDGEPSIVAALCTEAGFEVTPTQVAYLFAASDVTEQEPFVAFERLGLKMVQPDETAAT